jgi:heme-degrading monooxygenase HmoA
MTPDPAYRYGRGLEAGCNTPSSRADHLPLQNMEVCMVARTSTWAGSPDALDKWAEHVNAKVSGFVSGLSGNAGAVFLVDKDAGTALTLTLWDSEEAAAETDKFADQSRASTVEATGVELVERGSYSVVTRF